REFESTKAGVKGLVDSGITKIPRFFIYPSPLSENARALISYSGSFSKGDNGKYDQGQKNIIVLDLLSDGRSAKWQHFVALFIPLKRSIYLGLSQNWP
ncbi:hypothetical protein H5410_034665, partial [Solanum commersonii]